MFISVYTIAKNEEKVAERWYNCFKEADEVCVLVNNSTDKTAEVLRKLGAKVTVKNYSHFRFDTARNDAMGLCSKQATLLFGCDMDDMVEPGWRKKIEHAWELGVKTGKKPNAILFSYSVEYPKQDGSIQKQTFVRHSIHTREGWAWYSRIHEFLEHKAYKNFIFYPRFEMVSRPTKQEHGAYLGLLEEECKDPNCEARSIHLLGREYYINRRYEDAIEKFKQYLSHRGAIWDSERAASMRFMSDCYGLLGFPNARELWLWKAMAENPRDRDAPFLLGNILIQNKEYRTAEGVLERCVKIESPELDFPFFCLDAWTERPWCCLAEARFYIGKWNEAIAAVDKAIEIKPDSNLATRLKADILRVINSGAKPPLPPPEVPRLRIEIPELM